MESLQVGHQEFAGVFGSAADAGDHLIGSGHEFGLGADGHIEGQPEHADGKAGDHAPQGSLGGGPFPEDPQQEDRGDGGCQQSLYRLKIVIEHFPQSEHDGDPDDTQDDHGGCGDTPDNKKVFLGGVGFVFFIEVAHEEGCRGVKKGGQGTHQGCQQSAHHDTLNSGRQEL